ncbi:MAG: hypothetical protein AABW67_06600 [Nanoarchaeota archaeon]
MENLSKGIFISMIVLFVLVIGFYFVSNSITKYTGFSISEKDSALEEGSIFESCLQEQDIILYINTNNLQSLKEIQLFDYLQYFKMINCFGNNKICLDNGISSFPSWVINKNKIEKDISLDELKEISGCNELS